MRLSDRIDHAFLPRDGRLTVGGVLDGFSESGFGMLLAASALPVALPMTPPGVSAPFGLLIAMLGIQILRSDSTPWIPAKVRDKEVKAGDSKFQRMLTRSARFFERMLRPRFEWLYAPGSLRWVLGPAIILSAVTMMLPLPFTNSLSALAVCLIGLGMMERDGLFGIGGILVGALSLGIAILAIFLLVQYGPQGVEMIRDWVKGLRPG